jgi:hypothetical protein
MNAGFLCRYLDCCRTSKNRVMPCCSVASDSDVWMMCGAKLLRRSNEDDVLLLLFVSKGGFSNCWDVLRICMSSSGC